MLVPDFVHRYRLPCSSRESMTWATGVFDNFEGLPVTGNCLASDRNVLQGVVRTAHYITGAKLPAIQDLCNRRCQRKTQKIVKDSSHPSHRLFSLLLQVVPECQVQVQENSKQLLPQSHKAPEHLIKWLPRLFALPPLFYTAATLCCYHLCIATLITLPKCTYYLN